MTAERSQRSKTTGQSRILLFERSRSDPMTVAVDFSARVSRPLAQHRGATLERATLQASLCDALISGLIFRGLKPTAAIMASLREASFQKVRCASRQNMSAWRVLLLTLLVLLARIESASAQAPSFI